MQFISIKTAELFYILIYSLTSLFHVSGMKFAMLEMKAILSALLRRYQILPASSPHQLDLTVVLVLKSLTGVVLRLQPRMPQAATSFANDEH
jgi:hypothetical protein